MFFGNFYSETRIRMTMTRKAGAACESDLPACRGFPFMWTDEASGWKNETWQVKKDSARNREMLRHVRTAY